MIDLKPTQLDHKSLNTYSVLEEKINVYSHRLGAYLAFFALLLFAVKGIEEGTALDIISNCIFSISMIILYTVSAKYHSETDPQKRFQLKVFDHSAIYILIAGTYTPYALSVIKGSDGWILFSGAWVLGLIGITLKVFFTGRFKIISTLMYIFMGWAIVFYIKSIIAGMSEEGFNWLLYGGISYTVGALIYSIKFIPLNHAIFHVFVLLGSLCHFISIFFYV
ncbi:MAG: hemolysin III [Bacteriovoracaceae bacterium]